MADFGEPDNKIESLPMLAEDSDDETTQKFAPKSIKNSPNFQQNVIEQKHGKPRHSVILFFHIALKTVALIVYLGSNVFRLGYISTFVIVILFLSMDFWLTKNLSGRLLAGLRWWNHVDEKTGKMKWYYECWDSEDRARSWKSQGIML